MRSCVKPFNQTTAVAAGALGRSPDHFRHDSFSHDHCRMGARWGIGFYTFLSVVFLLVLSGCGQTPQGYGFAIENVAVNRGYQSLNVTLKPDMQLSAEALAALQHGVTLIIRLDLELRNDNNMIVVRRETRRYQVRYLPLSERYQLKESDSEKLQTYSRLRHVFAAIGDMDINLTTGPLPPGNYELRTRIQLDENLLPAPMQLPAMFSSQWKHDSEWSVWPFKVSV